MPVPAFILDRELTAGTYGDLERGMPVQVAVAGRAAVDRVADADHETGHAPNCRFHLQMVDSVAATRALPKFG